MTKHFARLAGIAALAVLVHGYHLGVDDAEIYVPAIKRVADPALYPFGSEFFLSHARLSLFPNLVGGSARLAHVPADFAIFAWHAIGVFLLLAAGWRLACACFESNGARWSAVALLAASFSIPAAGTALVVMDPYLTARTLSAPAALFAVACYGSNQPKRALAWLAFAALVHPQMFLFAVALIGIAVALGRLRPAVPAPVFGALSVLPLLFDWHPATGAAREALIARTYFFVYNWAWYEWLGVAAPLALLAWASRAHFRKTTPAFRLLARALVVFGLLATAAGMALATSPRFENLARLQPMRGFHLLYAVFFVMLGGLIGEYALKARAWRWAALFGPAAIGMWFLGSAAYPASPHVEWPGARGANTWTSAFYWIRAHTPKDAIFALDPDYMAAADDDQHGFRAVAERSALADRLKDSGVASLFPGIANEWKAEVEAERGWRSFQEADFERLAQRFPVTWAVVRRPAPAGMPCPYRNAELAVCRIK